ncbi:MAG TPA: hypothetical protein VNU44_00045, partial [Bryobacteraceae bacterium]|nr:hypothetical protein [Bryobacteraceae bacterium]
RASAECKPKKVRCFHYKPPHSRARSALSVTVETGVMAAMVEMAATVATVGMAATVAMVTVMAGNR